MSGRSATLVENQALPKPSKVNWERYRTSELADRVAELVSVPGALRRILTHTLLLLGLSCLVCYAVCARNNIGWIPWLGLSVYSLVFGAVLGVVLGVLRVVSSGLTNIEELLSIVLDTTGQVADDYQQLQAGKLQLPPGGELVEQVYEGVVMPALERGVSRAFGLFASPILWTYRRTIGNAVRQLVKCANRAKRTDEEEKRLQESVRQGMAAISDDSERMGRYIHRAKEVVQVAGCRVRCFALAPIYGTFIILMFVATVPLLVAVVVAA